MSPRLDPTMLRDELDTAAGEIPPDRPVRGPFIPSEYNLRVFEFLEREQGSLVIEATAGSGKTTQILQCIARIPKGQDVKVLAFNTGIVQEFSDRLAELPVQAYVEVQTFHAAAFGAVRNHLGNQCDLRNSKVRDLAKDLIPGHEYRRFANFCIQAVSLAKAEGIGTPLRDVGDWRSLIEHYDLQIDPRDPGTEFETQKAIGYAHDLLMKSNYEAEKNGVIDFDDQLYLIALWDLPCPQFAYVFIDEAQDTNVVRRDFARRSLREGGRIVCVGDGNQSIYGFTGATPDAMRLLQEQFNATVLPLSVNYRSGYKIIEHVQTIRPGILPRPDAPAGEVILDAPQGETVSSLTKFDAILCRNNAPLVELCYQLIAQGIAATILGRDIGTKLIDLLINLRAATLESLELRLDQYRKREMERWRIKGDLNKVARVDDEVACVKIIMAGLQGADRTLYGLEQAITGMFSENEKHILTLSTIHKAKGKEWPTVAILKPELMPAQWATQDWQIEQEKNLQFVAATRARDRLIYMRGTEK